MFHASREKKPEETSMITKTIHSTLLPVSVAFSYWIGSAVTMLGILSTSPRSAPDALTLHRGERGDRLEDVLHLDSLVRISMLRGDVGWLDLGRGRVM